MGFHGLGVEGSGSGFRISGRGGFREGLGGCGKVRGRDRERSLHGFGHGPLPIQEQREAYDLGVSEAHAFGLRISCEGRKHGA